MRKLPLPGFYLVRKYFIESLPECPIIALKKRKEKKKKTVVPLATFVELQVWY